MLRLVLAALVLLAPVGPSVAQSFDDAVALWLDGDDATSLPLLADLARLGHTDAQLLLGRLETEDMGPSPYRLSLTPLQARVLYRSADGSRFGRSWLSVAAESGSELAELLVASKQPEPSLDVIEGLNALGEREATDPASRILALYGSAQQRAKLLASAALLPDLKPYLRYLSAAPEPRGDGLAALRHITGAKPSADDAEALGMAGFLALGLGFGDHSAGNPWRPKVETWVMSAASTRPMARLCTQTCPEDAAACGFAMLAVSGGYFEAIRFDSPLERVIPQDRFLDSPRARMMVLYRAARARTETNQAWLADLPALDDISTCAAETIRNARAGFQP